MSSATASVGADASCAKASTMRQEKGYVCAGLRLWSPVFSMRPAARCFPPSGPRSLPLRLSNAKSKVQAELSTGADACAHKDGGV